MRDLLPLEAERRRALARLFIDHVALAGYKLVTPPAFELAEVLERGLGALDPSDVLRFVEPESGEVAALRPDMTPQIARMVATRLASQPRPIRLSYEGTIVRRRQGRARRHRQVPQAGVELYGAGGLAGDLEALGLAGSSLAQLGLEAAVIDVGHAGIGRALLAPLRDEHALAVSDALAQKDSSRVASLLAASFGERASLSPVAKAIAALPDLSGGGPGEPSGDEVIARAEGLFEGTAAIEPLHELRSLWRAARALPDLAPRLRLDLGELRGFAYYTGMIFHLLAEGPGEPIGAGGRYDDLLGRFDAPMPAVGFALALDAVARARDHAGVVERERPSAVVVGPRAAALIASLRTCGVPAVEHAIEGAEAYARAWRFTHVVVTADEGVRASVLDGEARTFDNVDGTAIAKAIAEGW